jgi:hypothetical protein
MNEDHISDFLQSGSLKGFFSYEEFWHYWGQLHRKYPQIIGNKFKIGRTFNGDDIEAFYMGENMSHEDKDHSKKNIIMITALHHSREPLTVTMVLYMVMKILAEKGFCGHNNSEKTQNWNLFFKNNVIMFIPMVNIDSYKYIHAHYQDSDGEEVLMIRKNRHVDPQCTANRGGVDLNRNYSFMFGANDTGSSPNPCEEDYRGAAPFSEPETQAIKSYVDGRYNLVTGINMHTYGNAWIFPFNFVHDANNEELRHKKPKFYGFYKEFILEMRRRHENAEFGNAQATVQYPTNGEAGDWLTAKHNIINLDVELGNLDKRSERFYPSKNLIPGIASYNWRIFRYFLWKHNINLVLHQVKRNIALGTLTFIVFNESISTLHDMKIHLEPILSGYKVDGRSLRLSKKKKRVRRSAWHKITHKKNKRKNKKSKKNRKLIFEPDYTISYRLVAKCGTASSKPMEFAKGNTIEGTLKGRYYIEIQFKFRNRPDVKKFTAVNIDLEYADGETKKFRFLTYAFKHKKNVKKHMVRSKKRSLNEERRLTQEESKALIDQKLLE